jgi:hypothetical protein
MINCVWLSSYNNWVTKTKWNVLFGVVGGAEGEQLHTQEMQITTKFNLSISNMFLINRHSSRSLLNSGKYHSLD